MLRNMHFCALFTTSSGRNTSRRIPAALALALVLDLGCGVPNDSGTTETSSEATTDDASTDSSDTGSSDTGSSDTDDTTTDGPGACADLCQNVSGCTDEVSLEQCLTSCEAADPVLRDCLIACNQLECSDLLMCTTLCSQPGDPDALPYDDCENGSASCQPGVIYCIESSFGSEDAEYRACAPFCDEQGNCPVPATGNATPVCEVNNTPALCSLDCSDGQQCPDDMVCDPGGRCMWPIP